MIGATFVTVGGWGTGCICDACCLARARASASSRVILGTGTVLGTVLGTVVVGTVMGTVVGTVAVVFAMSGDTGTMVAGTGTGTGTEAGTGTEDGTGTEAGSVVFVIGGIIVLVVVVAGTGTGTGTETGTVVIARGIVANACTVRFLAVGPVPERCINS